MWLPEDYLMCRPYQSGWLITRELVQDKLYSNAKDAYDRAISPFATYEAFFEEAYLASLFMKIMMEVRDNAGNPFTYSAQWVEKPTKK